jgi:hypothetical protein
VDSLASFHTCVDRSEAAFLCTEPEDAAEKAKHQKDTIKAQRIIADSIKDHLIPYVSSKNTLKENV